ncbi:pentapeptide repeat-containing protein [Deinococcus alpinitundrae]|uniref:pentapeptide repeat-containing protein n=1 Tax=Deinococcus alpinitundrae TaxID=468913 RepID=UPI00137B594C|nr:pentapeptide repeat-containing protein [Deinococcus alpinitundrae]
MTATPPPDPDSNLSDLQSVAQQAAQDVLAGQRPSIWARLANALPLVATLVTVVITLISTLQSQSQYRETQANERFQTAVTMLAASDLSSRLGGIYTLIQVAQSYPSQEYATTHILAAYLRSRFPSTDETRAEPLTKLPAVEEINAVMGGLVVHRDGGVSLDLGRISARGLMMRDQDLRGLIFPDADLRGSIFAGADLSNALFSRTLLSNVDFQGATLTGADFSGATLTGASFVGTDLSETKGLSAPQLASAKTDATTIVPNSFK